MYFLKNFINVGLNFIKKRAHYFSILLITSIVVYEFVSIESYVQYFFKITLIVSIPLFYFNFMYYLIDKINFFKIINPIILIKYYRNTSYLKKQINVIFLEEFTIKYLPFFLFDDYVDTFFWLIIFLTAVLFTSLHKFNDFFSLLEFFIFFATCHYFFLETHIFAVLFIPHLFRNLILEYLIRNKDD